MANEKQNDMIPKIINFIWFGKKELTDQQKNVIYHATKLNPDYEVRLILDSDPLENPTHNLVKEFLSIIKDNPSGFWARMYDYMAKKREYYRTYQNLGFELNTEVKDIVAFSNCFRTWLLNKTGGIYLDLDIEFRNPFDDGLLSCRKFFVALDDNQMTSVVNGVQLAIAHKNGNKSDSFFFGMTSGAIDNIVNSSEMVERIDWNLLSNGGRFLNYSTQNYITHLWNMSYLVHNGQSEKKMVLQFLVPQYKEKKEVLKPLLDSIALQQGVDFDTIGVVIVNDGYPKSRLPDKFLKSYPFKIEYYLEEHRGVSATRNSCLDHSNAEIVCFCDADDMFFSLTGINILLAEFNKEYNAIITNFYEEHRRADGTTGFIEHPNDRTFVHGKFYRRQFLIDNSIRFNDSLTVHEDSYFNCLATSIMPTQPGMKGVGYSSVPIYLWKWRDDSVCRRDPLYLQKTYQSYIDSVTSLVGEFMKRGQTANADTLIANQMFDTYYLMNTPDWLKQENQEYRLATERRFKKFYIDHKDRFDAMSDATKMSLSSQARDRKIKRNGMTMEKQTFDQWIEYIMGL